MTSTTALSIVPPKAITQSADAFALLDEYLAVLDEQVAAGAISAATRDTYASGIAKFVDFAVSRHAITGDIIMAWVALLRQAAYKPATVNTWLSGVRSFFRWAESEQRVAYNPAKGVKGSRRASSKRRHKRDRLTDSEVLRVLAQPGESDAGTRDRAYLALRAYTGARDIELHRADLADFTTRGNRAILNVHGKGHAEADDFVVLVPEAESALRDWLVIRGDKPGPLFTSLSNRSRSGRLSLRAIRWLVKKYYAAAGVTGDNKTSHSLRHSAITNAIEHGAPIQKAQSMARHEDVSTTAIYFHETDRIEHPAEEYIRYENSQ